MSGISRREFMGVTIAAAGGTIFSSLAARPARAQAAGANGDARLAVIGLKWRGFEHCDVITSLPGMRLAAICDVDPAILALHVERLKAKGFAPLATTDYRTLLDSPEIDAVTICTPNHWHALMAVQACRAGKDVYVEKPVAHTIREGRQIALAQKKYGRIVQAGTQTRSDTAVPKAIELIRGGKIGKVKHLHAMWMRYREPIGRKQPWYPDFMDYNQWCGPAPMSPLRRNECHYDWHWSWETGDGEMANLGNHMVDLARWIADAPAQPPRVLSLGGRFAWDDAGETPNTQLTLLDYPGCPIVVENRNLPIRPGAGDQMEPVRGFFRQGVMVQGETGYYAAYQNGGWFYDNDNKRTEQVTGGGSNANHFTNFVAAMRSRKQEELAAPIETGQRSTSSCHLGNISYRTGELADLETIRAAVADVPLMGERVESIAANLKVHGVDLAKTPLRLGTRIHFNAKDETIEKVEGAGDLARKLEEARFMAKGVQRPGFQIGEV